VKEAEKLAVKAGFKNLDTVTKLSAGDKVYAINRKKNLCLFVIGKKPLTEGLNILGAHTDSPRLDLKQHPIYEKDGLVLLDTHYYGGIKKYQWTAIPLSIHGCVIRADGTSVDVIIGEDDTDPVFYVNDLLPHLAKNQVTKPLADGITGEQLNILIGSEPLEGDIKLALIKILNEKYGITEADFISAELTVVPAYKSREIGFDRSLIGGYGHDDRVCSYPSLLSIIEAENPVHTLMVILADKEETGSGGNSGMQCDVFTDLVSSISNELGANEYLVRKNSKCLSADVNAAFDPNFADAYESRNSAFINNGVVLTKYTGSRGKGGTSDASAEFVGYVRNIFDKAGIVWQTGELGKVDQGGGGTVAIYIAEKNIDVVDLGVPVISMHAPWEVVSKADCYMTYKAFKAFNE
jgi:aspartyl aminopeptidase